MNTVRTYVNSYIEIQAQIDSLNEIIDSSQRSSSYALELLSEDLNRLESKLEAMLNTPVELKVEAEPPVKKSTYKTLKANTLKVENEANLSRYDFEEGFDDDEE